MEKGWWDKIDLMVFCMKWPSTWSWACLFFLATWLAITWMKCQNIRYSATLLKYKYNAILVLFCIINYDVSLLHLRCNVCHKVCMVCAAPCEYSTGDYTTITCVSTCMSLAGEQRGREGGRQAGRQGGEQAGEQALKQRGREGSRQLELRAKPHGEDALRCRRCLLPRTLWHVQLCSFDVFQRLFKSPGASIEAIITEVLECFDLSNIFMQFHLWVKNNYW